MKPKSLFVLALYISCAVSGGAADWKRAMQDTLEGAYPLTQASPNRSDIVTAGVILVLRISGFTVARADINTPRASSTYRDGAIKAGLLAAGMKLPRDGTTHTLNRGQKLWVTQIDIVNDGIVFECLTDPIGDIRYAGNLKFPFPKGSQPAPDQILPTIAEVFQLEGSTPATQTASVPPPLIDPPSSVPAATASAPEPDHTPWNSKYGRMTNDDLQRIDDPTVRFDLNYFRLNPAALDQKPVMQYFIALNNCNNRDVERAMFNELDYPALAEFYKSKAPQILAALPKTVIDLALYRYIGGQQSGNWVLWSKSLNVGEYNQQRKAFPLTYPGRDSVEIPESLATQSSERDLGKSCPVAARAARSVHADLPSTYVVSLKPAIYRELPMDEEAARKYIDRAPSQRNVFLAVDVTILDGMPTISRANNGVIKARFGAQAARIRVIDGKTVKPLGTLFDDHSLPADVQVTQAPAPLPPSPPNSFAFGDHMYDVRTAAYIVLAADACGWPLTDEQSANVRRFADQMSRGGFNERYQYNLAIAQTRTAINANGRRNYCADAAERQKFEKSAATVAPLGPLAAPVKK